MRLIFLVSFLLCPVVIASAQSDVAAEIRSAKIAPNLFSIKDQPTDFLVEVYDSIQFTQWVKQSKIYSIQKLAHSFYKIHGRPDLFQNLRESGIQFMDRANRKPQLETVLGEFDIFANAVSKAHDHFSDITGSGRIISIKEKPFDPEDIDLKPRVIINNQFDEPSSLHATIMATIAAGAGNSSSFAKGVAYGAKMTTSDFENLLPDNGSSLTQAGITVQNHSYGVGVENYYGIESKEYDRSVKNSPSILHVFSSGNSGDQAALAGIYAGIEGYGNLTGQFKTSKNTLAVGSADRFGKIVARSSRGPAAEGRVKPELMAFGDAGSSESAALVSGIALLLQQAYEKKNGSIPDAALVKSILINSADDTGRPQVDFETGFGNVNALRALRTIDNGNILAGEILSNEVRSFSINVPADQDLLKATLVWTDPEAEPFSSKALVNDLNVAIRNTNTSEEWLPWILDPTASTVSLEKNAVRGIDTLNNVEQVTIAFPVEGNYEIVVRSKKLSTASQKFYIAFEWTAGFEWIYPSVNSFLKVGTPNVLRWSWFKDNEIGSLEYKRPEEVNWTKIDDVNLKQQSFEWETPTQTGLVQFRMQIGSVFFESPIIPITSFIRPSINFNCSEEFMISWNKDPGATDYAIYKFNSGYGEPAITIQDTLAIISKADFSGTQVAVVPRYGTSLGGRDFIFDYQSQGVGCYFITFLPQAPIVYDNAIFNIRLGTTYNLKSATLESISGTNVKEISTLTPISNTSFSFSTDDLIPEVNKFRVKLITHDQKIIYSPEVEVFFVKEKSIYVYPNPIVAGADANIMVNTDEEADIFLTELSGKQILKAEDFGSIKVINTTNLTRGVYFIKVVTADGKIWNSKLLVM